MLHVVFSFQSLILRGRGRRRSSVEEEGKLELLCERVVGEQAFSWIGFKKWATKKLLYASGAKQASKTAMPSFSNNECANSRALTPTVDLLHVFICLTCFWLLNCRPGFSRSCFYFFPRSDLLLLQSLMWGPAVSYRARRLPLFHLPRLLAPRKSQRGEININQ